MPQMSRPVTPAAESREHIQVFAKGLLVAGEGHAACRKRQGSAREAAFLMNPCAREQEVPASPPSAWKVVPDAPE